MIKGEINVLRYFSRRFNLFNLNSMSEVAQAHMDSILDSAYSEIFWGTGNLSRVLASTFEPLLKKSNFLVNDQMTLLDVFAFALMSNEKNGKWSPALQEWMKRCSSSLKGNS